jgi:hypothetical protein
MKSWRQMGEGLVPGAAVPLAPNKPACGGGYRAATEAIYDVPNQRLFTKKCENMAHETRKRFNDKCENSNT